jgi:hypothetical protein
MFLSSKAWPVHKADNFTATHEPTAVDNMGSLTSHNPTDLQGLLRGWLYFFTFYSYIISKALNAFHQIT